ncbi:MAG: hypothetical protein JWR16_3347 [Nevskia sp.]|nr:hypothetical protein [Nevskia sp.]
MSHEHHKLRVMLVDDDRSRLEMVEQALHVDGHQVVAKLGTDADLSAAVIACQPQIIFIDVDAPGRDTLESLGQLNREHPRPIVLFAARSDAETIRRAVHAGVSAYVVDGLQPNRISSVIEVAIARFEMHQALQKDLEQARSRLADQRDIQRAKGIIMKRRQLDENEAFVVLRKMAMDRKQRLGDFARVVLSVADAL